MNHLPVIKDSQPSKMAWDIVMTLVILVSSIEIPYRLTFGTDQFDLSYWFITAFFLFDILIHFNTAVLVKHQVLSDRRSIAIHYFKSGFVIDFLAAFPFAAFMLLFVGTPTAYPIFFNILLSVRLLRLLKLVNLNKTLRHIQEALSINPSVVRLVIFLFWFVLITHFIALGWLLIGAGEREGTSFHRYIVALYWTVTTTATIGYGDITPDRAKHIQLVYTMFVQLVGVGMFGYVIGNIASLMTNIDVAKANFTKKLDELNTFFRIRHLPKTIQDKVRDYYGYLWDTRRTADSHPDTVVFELPRSLKVDILLHLNRSIIEKVAWFKTMNEEFIREVVELVEPLVFLPNDYIIHEGEYGDCMYFLSSGEMEVIVGNQKVAELSSGSPFGETALVREERRNASIRALTYCDVYKLSKENFNLLRVRYPEFDAKVKEIAAYRLQDTAAKTGHR